MAIIRPPLVYGPGAKGNFARLLSRIAGRGMMPFGKARNSRSFIGVENLADALLRVSIAPRLRPTGARPGSPAIYHVSDSGVISTARLISVLAGGLGVEPRMIDVPRWMAVGGACLLGKGAMARRLFDDLEVDDSDFRRDFSWLPRIDLECGLRGMAEDHA